MSTTTLLIVIIVLVLLFGGFGYRRWRNWTVRCNRPRADRGQWRKPATR